MTALSVVGSVLSGVAQQALGNGVGYIPEALSLFARAPTLTTAQRTRINKRLAAYKSAGTLAQLDALYGFKDAPTAALNWIADQYNLTESGSITHVPGQGYQNAGGHLKTGFVPSTASSPKYVQDSLTFGVWIRNPLQAASRQHMAANNGTTYSTLEANIAPAILFRGNNAVGSAGSYLGGSLLLQSNALLVRRANASTVSLFMGGVSRATLSVASNGVPSVEFPIGARNNNGTISNATNDMYQGALIGAALTDQQVISAWLADLDYVTDIVAWGDSLTGGSGASAAATRYPSVAGDAYSPKREVSNQGIGGQTSTQIAARMGVQPITCTVTGNEIPASGGVSITGKNINPLVDSGSYTGLMLGSLAGVPGVMTTDGSGNWTFTRTTAGSAVSCPANTRFVPDVPAALSDKVAWLWLGRNGADSGFTVLGDIALAVASYSRYLVGSILTSSADSGAEITAIEATNASLLSTYGSHYVDVLGALQAANDGSADDLADVAAGYTPRSLRSDAVHLNDAGYAIAASTFKAAADALGY